MTVIAWDGRTLAADKRGTNVGLAYAVTKIHRLPDGLVAFSGGGAHAGELLNWFHGARNPANYPRLDSDDGAGALMINQDGGIFVYSCANPFPERIEGAFFARGSGRDYAMAAMHLGCDAKRAVEVACALDVFCGNGIDVLELHPTEPPLISEAERKMNNARAERWNSLAILAGVPLRSPGQPRQHPAGPDGAPGQTPVPPDPGIDPGGS